VGHFSPYGGTVQTMGLDSSVLRSEVSIDTSVLVPKCPDTSDPSEQSQCRNVSGPKCHLTGQPVNTKSSFKSS